MADGELSQLIEKNISEPLQYACRYWPLHITQMDASDFAIIEVALRRFLFEERRLMQWIEIMSLLKMMDAAWSSMRSLEEWFTVSELTVRMNAVLDSSFIRSPKSMNTAHTR